MYFTAVGLACAQGRRRGVLVDASHLAYELRITKMLRTNGTGRRRASPGAAVPLMSREGRGPCVLRLGDGPVLSRQANALMPGQCYLMFTGSTGQRLSISNAEVA